MDWRTVGPWLEINQVDVWVTPHGNLRLRHRVSGLETVIGAAIKVKKELLVATFLDLDLTVPPPARTRGAARARRGRSRKVRG